MKKNLINYIKSVKNSLSIKKIIGFSLVELMISLITISCICAAFAPVITKKLNKSAVAIKSGNQMISDCTKFEQNLGNGKYSNFCKACYPSQCIVCTRTCMSNQHLNLANCMCENCPTNCAACVNPSVCDRCAMGYYRNSAHKCILCPIVQDGIYYCCPEGTENAPKKCDLQNQDSVQAPTPNGY